jgi:hypothetical protein
MIIMFLKSNVMNKKDKKQPNLISDEEYYKEIAPHFKDYNIIMKRGTGKETLKEIHKKIMASQIRINTIRNNIKR